MLIRQLGFVVIAVLFVATPAFAASASGKTKTIEITKRAAADVSPHV